MAMIVFSGAAQILAMQLIAAQAPFAVIVLTCFVVGLRLMMYSAAMAPHLAAAARALAQRARVRAHRPGVRRGDPALRHRHDAGRGRLVLPRHRRRALGGVAVSNLAGYLAGNVIPAAWSLEFVVPLCFIALLVPALDDGPARIAALAAAVAVVALDALPMRLSLVCAGLDRHRRRARSPSVRRRASDERRR